MGRAAMTRTRLPRVVNTMAKCRPLSVRPRVKYHLSREWFPLRAVADHE